MRQFDPCSAESRKTLQLVGTKWIKNRLEDGEPGIDLSDKGKAEKKIDSGWPALRRSMMFSALSTAATPETIEVLNLYRGRLMKSMKIDKDAKFKNELEIIDMNIDRAHQIQAAGGVEAADIHR